ncbi:MAG: T9SS type A sorting domain-containing protein [Flavobacteriales bacterium]|nr:T9SS type A sorting domain-containing protein [Flavobacteriales bacterium]
MSPREPTDLLYVTGFPDTLCGPEYGQVFTYDGATFSKWTPFDEIPFSQGYTYTGLVFTYQNKTYVTGAFVDPYTGAFTSMMRYNGVQWETIPGWNNNGPIKDFTIENDTLYLCGAFRQDEGAPGNLVVAYDGENWNDLGGGLTFPSPIAAVALEILRWRGELYACGVFSDAGGIPVDRLAKWNGRQWCRLPGNFSNNGALSEMAVWRDSLYIAGGFITIDGDTMNTIAQWIGGDAVEACSAPVGVVEHRRKFHFSLYPNPTNGLLYMTLKDALRSRELFVSDALGREVLRQGAPHSNTGPLILDLAPLSPGAYLVTVVDEQGMHYTQRVLRE